MSNADIAMKPAWKLMGRPSPFVPWIFLGYCHRLEDAVRQVPELKKRGRFYTVHVWAR